MASAWRIAFTSSATAVRANSNWAWEQQKYVTLEVRGAQNHIWGFWRRECLMHKCKYTKRSFIGNAWVRRKVHCNQIIQFWVSQEHWIKRPKTVIPAVLVSDWSNYSKKTRRTRTSNNSVASGLLPSDLWTFYVCTNESPGFISSCVGLLEKGVFLFLLLASILITVFWVKISKLLLV